MQRVESVSQEAKQGSFSPAEWPWVDRTIWTERMLAALGNGVRGTKWFSLIDKVYRPQTLERAWQDVRANRGAAGVDGQSVRRFEAHAERYLAELGEALQNGRYRPEAVRRVEIPKGTGTRPLGIPTVKDRIVQAAVKRVIEPIFEHQFLPMSYGFRPGRGCKDALREVDGLIREGYTYVVDADLAQYFDTIPHEALLARVEERISDGRLLDLLRAWLRQDVVAEMVRWTQTRGSPQGAVISPLLANLYLHPLDVHMTERGYRMVRYADDRVPRRRTRGRKPSVQPCCTRDEGGPLGAAVQAEASNHPLLLPSREVVVSELGKGGAGPCQVRTVESNVSEPLRTCRKRRDDVKTGGESLLRDQSGGHLSTAQMASGMKAARTRSRLLCGTWEPVTPMPRERCKGKPPECLSTDAGYRGGATRSSEEGPVMGLERRGCPIQLETKEQLVTGGLF